MVEFLPPGLAPSLPAAFVESDMTCPRLPDPHHGVALWRDWIAKACWVSIPGAKHSSDKRGSRSHPPSPTSTAFSG